MRVLVTGASGFLGAALARAHRASGDEVLALRHTTPLPPDLAGAVEELRGDLRDAERLGRPAVDVLYHCAALMADREDAPYAEFHRINVLGTVSLLRAARSMGLKRFVHVSSAGVLGHTQAPATEADPYGRTLTKYERSKMEAEIIARQAMQDGLPVTIVRPAQLYGPGMRHLWPKLIDAIRRGRAVRPGPGAAKIHFTHIDDVVCGIRLAAEAPCAVGQLYHLAAASPVTARHALESIARALGVRPPRPVPYWPVWAAAAAVERLPWHLRSGPWRMLTVHHVELFARDRVYAIDKARTELGYGPVVSWDDALASVVASYVEPQVPLHHPQPTDPLERMVR
ncbi:MAG: NAD-dependent epimerase/dehydratase family protein [Candidatus Omnitrophica bacterium]|nr:NAD-dependent epimerase/dehydratase family protein [Candidatus Omnitrophota bacterium]